MRDKGLSAITVVDFSKLLPGPYCTQILADMGCRVIRVELPHWPDGARELAPKIKGHGFCYWMVNRNKESLCLDFRKEAGMNALRKLLAKADVVVEGFRPGLMDKLGLGPRELRRRYPRLVYCSITGWGPGPWAARAGHDLNFQASSGLLALGDSNGAVTFPPVQLADLAASQHAASAILGALLERGATGKGRRLEVSMAEAAFGFPVMALGAWLAAGKTPERRSAWWNGRYPLYRLYRTADDRHLAVGILERNFAADFLRAIGRADLETRLAGAETDDGFAVELEEVFRGKTLAEWMKVFDGKDVCVSPVLTFDEALREPHWAGLKLMTGPGAGHVRPPVTWSGKPFKVSRRPPNLGADNRRVLKSAGVTDQAIRALERSGLLKGR